MLMALLGPVWQIIKAPRVLAGIAGLLLVAGFFYWLHAHDTAVIDKHKAQVTKEVGVKTDKAGTAASNAVIQSKQEVEQSNANARDAAARSDDPLRAGLDSLRGERPHRVDSH